MGFIIFLIIIGVIILAYFLSNSSFSKSSNNSFSKSENSDEESERDNRELIEQEKVVAMEDAKRLAGEWSDLNSYYDLPDFEKKREEFMNKIIERLMAFQTYEGAIEFKNLLSEPEVAVAVPYYINKNGEMISLDSLWYNGLSNQFNRQLYRNY